MPFPARGLLARFAVSLGVHPIIDLAMTNLLSFKVDPLEGAFAIMPVIDGTPLADLISAYEVDREYETGPKYGHLIPSWFNYGPLEPYFLGESKDEHWVRLGGIWLLGCECGEVGCWPLQARVHRSDDQVEWSEFRQPYRPERDYSGFGPFVFKASQYVNEIHAVIHQLGTTG